MRRRARAGLSHGLDITVGERSTALSGRPRLLVLDDATSAVDPRVEAAILVVAYRRANIYRHPRRPHGGNPGRQTAYETHQRSGLKRSFR